MTVWVVEQGEYSDYHVVGVFSSRERAQQIADAINADRIDSEFYRASVDEWPLDPAVDELHKGYRQFIVNMLRDGTVERCDAISFSAYDIAGEARMWRRSQAPAYAGKGVQDCLHATVWADDDKHAIKIANEKRAQLIASGEWEESGDVSAQVNDPGVGR